MSDANPYAPPQSAVTQSSAASSQSGSLERGIAGDYDFEIGTVLSEAWQKTSGMKLPFFIAAIIFYIAFIALIVGGTVVLQPMTRSEPMLAMVARQLVQMLVVALLSPMIAGMMMMGVRHVAGLPISFSTVFNYFGLMATLFVAALLTSIFEWVGIFLLVLPGLYLSVAYMFVLPLIADKKLGVWQAMEASRKAITAHWFKFFFLGIVVALIVLVSMIPLFIGLIWTGPMAINALGVVYRTAFGVSST